MPNGAEGLQSFTRVSGEGIRIKAQNREEGHSVVHKFLERRTLSPTVPQEDLHSSSVLLMRMSGFTNMQSTILPVKNTYISISRQFSLIIPKLCPSQIFIQLSNLLFQESSTTVQSRP